MEPPPAVRIAPLSKNCRAHSPAAKGGLPSPAGKPCGERRQIVQDGVFEVLLRVEAQIRLIVGADVNGLAAMDPPRFESELEGGRIIRPVMQDLPRLALAKLHNEQTSSPLGERPFPGSF